ncbi:hypothetical protein L226DRAFT_309587 [Lentinus tigrinus ALCF2SS1-7]|uniref:uncharacterized protein n=1 Tax=Lentinus tigrinus ALCF2SS1-7 TaxID=1328758 RepID=UPI001165FA32|nr:hypothetical protein L226DRAFT_309587 [Lentinus tigrinus ALCF2SS1-7]
MLVASTMEDVLRPRWPWPMHIRAYPLAFCCMCALCPRSGHDAASAPCSSYMCTITPGCDEFPQFLYLLHTDNNCPLLPCPPSSLISLPLCSL